MDYQNVLKKYIMTQNKRKENFLKESKGKKIFT